MSDAGKNYVALPDVPTFMQGKESIRPLWHTASDVQRFAAEFNDQPLSPASADKLVQLQDITKNPAWRKAHDGAFNALHDAMRMVEENPSAELAKHADSMGNIFRARAPSADSLRVVKNETLQEILQPLARYLEEFGHFTTAWAGLQPSRLKAKDADGITPATHRMNLQAAMDVVKKANPGIVIPECGDINCTVEHGAENLSGVKRFFTGGGGHLNPAAAIPKGQALHGTLAALGATALGAVAINAWGKRGRRDSPNEVEKTKTDLDRAEDISYTINHALSCGTTDVVLQPLVAAATGLNVGCNHPGHNHPPGKLSWKSFRAEAAHYFAGEIIGDFAAVPLTIGVQRLFPNFMEGLRRMIEPVTGWAFRMGANHTAHRWAAQQGLRDDAPEVTARAEAIYQHEVSHLPQAVVWNMFAYPLGAFAQKATGHHASYPEIFKSKLVGAVVSNGLLLGGRAMAPAMAEKWDQFTGERLFKPVSKTVGRIFGGREPTTEALTREKFNAEPSWKDRVDHDNRSTPAMTRIV